MLAPDWFARFAENTRARLGATLPMEQHRKKRKKMKKNKWIFWQITGCYKHLKLKITFFQSSKGMMQQTTLMLQQ
jgi:hypothetical protein